MHADVMQYMYVSSGRGGITAPRSGDAGYDLRASDSVTIWPDDQVLVPTGVCIALPAGYVGLIKDRSSMANARIYTHAGVIDASYRGEVLVLLENRSDEPFRVVPGHRIAQLLVIPIATPELEPVLCLPDTERGDGGFGSTGQ